MYDKILKGRIGRAQKYQHFQNGVDVPNTYPNRVGILVAQIQTPASSLQ